MVSPIIIISRISTHIYKIRINMGQMTPWWYTRTTKITISNYTHEPKRNSEFPSIFRWFMCACECLCACVCVLTCEVFACNCWADLCVFFIIFFFCFLFICHPIAMNGSDGIRARVSTSLNDTLCLLWCDGNCKWPHSMEQKPFNFGYVEISNDIIGSGCKARPQTDTY